MHKVTGDWEEIFIENFKGPSILKIFTTPNIP